MRDDDLLVLAHAATMLPGGGRGIHKNWESLGDLGPLVPHTKDATTRHMKDGRLVSVTPCVQGYHQKAEEAHAALSIEQASHNMTALWKAKGKPPAIVKFAHHARLGWIGCTYRQLVHLHDHRKEPWGIEYNAKHGTPTNYETAKAKSDAWEKEWTRIIAEVSRVLVMGKETLQDHDESKKRHRIRVSAPDPKAGQVQAILDNIWDMSVEPPATQTFLANELKRLGLEPKKRKDGDTEYGIHWIVTAFFMDAVRAAGTKAHQGDRNRQVPYVENKEVLSPPVRYPDPVIARLQEMQAAEPPEKATGGSVPPPA